LFGGAVGLVVAVALGQRGEGARVGLPGDDAMDELATALAMTHHHHLAEAQRLDRDLAVDEQQVAGA
jgi:hypothetical protein